MERSDLSVVPVVFNGENYFYWSKAAKTVLSSRGLWSHIDEGDVVTNKGKSPETENSSQENDKWYQEDQKVLAILQSSLDQQILRSFILANSAKALWNNLKEVYATPSELNWKLASEWTKRENSPTQLDQ
ncbi:PREDICTED: uncharacterized protein LOC104798767 isoform X2 [Tarenaya hassleriana]|uniref:uncharacterized protein LOC104798767 isoform X2 n=1 Tax=Tarenaya hassleriana TaxID=28532 RepID=UPI00053CA73F|nr:PREDICTED: uncharacterized protein LOC104798767 isoform X2 [Tarenaya hassleriana]